MEYKPMPIENVIKYMKYQTNIWRIQKKIDKANMLHKAVVNFEKETQDTIDKLRKEYDKIRFL